MLIGQRRIGPGAPQGCYVIAEAGSNHSGDLVLAHRLVEAAAAGAADAVKFQLFSAERLYDDKGRQDALRPFEMLASWLGTLSLHAQGRGLHFLCSVFDEAGLDLVDPYVPAHKVASIEAQWPQFVAAVAGKRKPMLVSVGASDAATAAHLEIGWSDVILLECSLAYPTPIADAQVRWMTQLGQSGRLFGYSDHTRDPRIVPCAAVALGASVIEKHLRLDEQPDTPDAGHSISPAEFREMVHAIRATEAALGGGTKRVRDIERGALALMRGPKGFRGA